jgi:hypothetical protein
MNAMIRHLIRGASALTLMTLFTTGLAQAADAPGLRIGVRGEITGVSPDALKVHVNSIKPGSYIGSAAIPQDDGTLKALEVHVFPPELAGSGDGHRPFDLVKGSSMTNGSVGDLVVSNGRVLTVNYKGGQQKILVPMDVPIVNLMPGDRSLLKVGVKIVTFVTQSADGTLTAQSISAGKDGVTPPM